VSKVIPGIDEVGISIATHAGKEMVTRAISHIFKRKMDKR